MNASPDSAVGTADVNILSASGEIDETRAFTEIHLADGRVFRLNTRAIGRPALEQFERPYEPVQEDEAILVPLIVPLVEEQLVVGKRTIETGKVLLQKTVQEYQQALNEPLALRTYDIERKILNQPVESAPLIRQEGETTIYPVVEEQLILTKQLVLKEEIHVTRRDGERIDTQVVTLRREHLSVEREQVFDESHDSPERP